MAKHTEDENQLVVYVPVHSDEKETSLDGAKFRARPLTMRYEPIEYNACIQPRFTKIDVSTDSLIS